MKTSTITLQLSSLKIGYESRGTTPKVVHEGINATLRAGEVTCLMGLNGAGKSTLLRTICGFQKPLSGEITIMGKAQSDYSSRALSQIIGVVLTDKINAGGVTLRELVSLGRHPYTGFFGRLTASDIAIVDQAMEDVAITHKADCYVADLSDGERQKAMIAKALAQQSPIIILDEPTAFLDVTSRIELLLLLRNLALEQNKTILLSTHDLDISLELADTLWLQSPSEPLHCATPQELIQNGTLERFFTRGEVIFDKAKLGLRAVKK